MFCCKGIECNSHFTCIQEGNMAATRIDKRNAVHSRGCSKNFLLSSYLSYDNSSNDFLFGYCTFCHELTLHTKVSKPTVVVAYGNEPVNLCRPNATGFLCSECNDGLYHNRRRECVSCPDLALEWFIFVLIELLPITLLFLFLYITGFNLVTGGWNSAIFFAQMITTTTDITGNGYIPISNVTNNTQVSENLVAAYHFIYDIWNLEFFSPFSMQLCLFHRDSFLFYFFVEYGIVLYAIVSLAIALLLRALFKRFNFHTRLCNRWVLAYEESMEMNWKKSAHNATLSTTVLIYSKLAITSTMLVLPVNIFNRQGDFVRVVSLFDPSVDYISFPYIFVVVLALIILVILFLYPILILVLKYLREKDTFRKHLCLKQFVRPFLQHPEQEEGGIDFHWVEALYFLLRVLLLAIYASPLIYIKKYAIQQAIILIGAMFISFFQPYKEQRWMNQIDTFILLLLVFINTISIYQYSLTEAAMPLSLFAFIVQYILLYIPAVWMVGFSIYKLYDWAKRRVNIRQIYRRGRRDTDLRNTPTTAGDYVESILQDDSQLLIYSSNQVEQGQYETFKT